ncbi:MAG: RNA 3'-terminal phosphate cyclase [Thermoproteota archaeon]
MSDHNMDMLKIDGSFGEGGGQILRSALTLSCITRKPIQIENIRYNRKPPGLKPSHLATVKLLAKICKAEVEGMHAGSTSLKFSPGKIENVSLKENVGTAGSIPLILQALIPAVSLANKRLELSITGGTDVPWSPTSNYTKFVLAEAYTRIGINFTIDIKKRGYYPKGGGLVELVVQPTQKTKPISLTKRTQKNAKILYNYSRIPETKIDESLNSIKETLEKNQFSAQTKIIQQDAPNSGASVLVYSYDSDSVVGSDELLDNKAEFGKNAATNFVNSLAVDVNLSDMLVAPLSLTNGLSVFTVQRISKHLETNLYITSKITGCKYGIGKIDGGFEVRIEGSDSSIQ